jgi:hypothetical protein
VRERNEETSQAKENVERVKDEVGVQITKVYNRLETIRSMIDVAKESLDAFEENPVLSKISSNKAQHLHQRSMHREPRSSAHRQDYYQLGWNTFWRGTNSTESWDAPLPSSKKPTLGPMEFAFASELRFLFLDAYSPLCLRRTVYSLSSVADLILERSIESLMRSHSCRSTLEAQPNRAASRYQDVFEVAEQDATNDLLIVAGDESTVSAT